METAEQIKARIEELEAELSYHKTQSATLKLANNSSFGKFGSKYSSFYAPQLLIQTTITGQLALLMLIERLALGGIKTVSANTDGVVLYYPKEKARDVDLITFEWQLDTSYLLEKTVFKSLASRDVNNYIAVKPDGSIKGKGCFAKTGLSKNPSFNIIYEAVANFIVKGKPIVDS